jgi:NTP pyrophosphatase (non-canonical NTP hydrolase)
MVATRHLKCRAHKACGFNSRPAHHIESMFELPANSTIKDLQALIRQLVIERGFEKETVTEVFTILVEEVGELAKAIRQANGQKIGAHSKQRLVADEAADVLWLLIDICNRLDIDLEAAFRAKEITNQSRSWNKL